MLSNIQDHLLQIMQLIQYPHVSLFSTVITNEFIGEDVYLSQNSMDGYEAMRFDVTQLTQDLEQSLFTIKTSMPIPHSGRDDLILSAKLIRIAPETSSF